MWAEDNYGYIRQIPTETERNRAGGAGVYYHGSYSGNPTSYLWLNSIQLSLMCEQFQRAYNGGVRNQWILNAGDIKPGDQSIECYAKLAWDTQQFNGENAISDFLREITARDYGLSGANLTKAVNAMDEYYQIIGTKKPEYYTVQDNRFNFSTTSNGDEALLWLERCQKMVDALTEVYNTLNTEKKIAFYEQIYYHALSVLDTANEYVYYWKAQQAAEQGRVGSLDVYIELSKAAAAQIRTRTDEYNNINGTKWTGGNNAFQYKGETVTGFMTWQHVRLDGSPLNRNHDIIQNNEYPSISADRLASLSGIGVAVEGSATAGNGTLSFNSLYTDEQRYFDVFSQQKGQLNWTAVASEDWIKLSSTSGATATEQRVIVTVDWSKVTGTQTGTVMVYTGTTASGDPVATITVNAVNATSQLTGATKGYQEANGYVMIEAEAYSSKASGSDGSTWAVVKSNAQRGNTMKADDTTSKSSGTNGAKLTYNVYFENAGTYTGYLYRVPTLNEGTGKTAEVAIGVVGTTPAVLSGQREWQEDRTTYNVPNKVWGRNVMRQCEPLEFTVTVTQGWNEIVLYRLDASIVVDRIAIQTSGDALRPSLFGDALLTSSSSDITTIQLDRSLLGPVTSPNNLGSPYTGKVAALPEEMGSAIIRSDMTLTVGDSKTEYTGQSNVSAVEGTEDRVATVAVENGKLMVTPKQPGTTSVTITATEGGKEITFTITVTVNPKSVEDENLVYKPNSDGTIVIDPHDIFAAKHPAASTTPGKTTYWGMSGISVKALPDTGTQWTTASLEGVAEAPKMTFEIDAGDGGTFALYVNTSNPDGSSDSYHVLVDGAYVYANTDSNMSLDKNQPPEKWYHKNSGGDITLTAGKHSITIAPREDGFTLNQIALVNKSGGTAPSGTTLYTADQFSKLGEPTEVAPTISLELDKTSLSLRVGQGTETVTATASATNNNAVTIIAESSAEGVATVSVSGTTITVTPVAEGTANITVKASATGCEEVTKTVSVNVASADTGEGKAYLEKDGVIVIDAVDAMGQKVYASHTTATTADSNAAPEGGFYWTAVNNSASIQLMPISSSTKYTWTKTTVNDLSGKSPSLSFKVYATEAGDYHFSFYSASPNTQSDSFHIVVNGTYQYQSGDRTNGAGDAATEKWYTCKKTVPLNAGENTITIYGRESGTLFHQLMLSKEYPTSLSGRETSTLGDIPEADVSQEQAPAQAIDSQTETPSAEDESDEQDASEDGDMPVAPPTEDPSDEQDASEDGDMPVAPPAEDPSDEQDAQEDSDMPVAPPAEDPSDEQDAQEDGDMPVVPPTEGPSDEQDISESEFQPVIPPTEVIPDKQEPQEDEEPDTESEEPDTAEP